MKKIFFTPGPSQLYPTIPYHIRNALKNNICSISHRSKLFQTIFAETVISLRKLMNIPKTHQIFFLSSALEIMERILQNTVEEYSFHFINGEFSKKWYQFALDLHKSPRKYEVKPGNGFDFSQVKIPEETELICITQNETSTGVSIPLSDIYTLRKHHPKVLIALDIVSSAPYLQIDFSKINMAFFSVQKGFGLPAGLSVLIVNNQVLKKSVGTYHSFQSLLKIAEKNQTPETPNVLFIYLLGKICQDMLKKGITTIRKETDKKADLIYNFTKNNSEFRPFVKDMEFQSPTTIVLELIGKKSDEVVTYLEREGFIVGKGYGEFKEKQIRIANFLTHSVEDIKKIIKVLLTL